MLKRLYIIFLISLLNFSSGAFALQAINLNTPVLIAADKIIDSAWDDEDPVAEDDSWEEEDWDEEAEWEQELAQPLSTPAKSPSIVAPSSPSSNPSIVAPSSSSSSPAVPNSLTPVPAAPSPIITPPSVKEPVIPAEPSVTVSGPGFKASSTPAPRSILIQAEPTTLITAPAPLSPDDIVSGLTAAASGEQISSEAIPVGSVQTEDQKLIESKSKYSSEEIKTLFKIYGGLLKGLDPNNPDDFDDIEKLIEIVGIPTVDTKKRVATPPAPKPGIEAVSYDPAVNFSARNIPIRDAFATLARVSGKSITVSGLIGDRDSISVIEVNNQPFTKAFLSLVEAAEVDFTVHGDNYTILKRRGGQSNKTTASFGTSEVDTNLPIEDRVADLAYDDESLGAVIKDIAEKYGVDIVLTAVPTDKVTLRVRGVGAEDALQLAFAGSQFQYTRKDDAFIVYSKTNKNFSLGRKSVFFPLKYLEAKEISALLPTDLKANVKVSDNQNAIIVEGTKDELTQIFEFLRTVDKPIPQVELDVKLVEVAKNFARGHNILQDQLQIGRIGGFKALSPSISGIANGALQLVGFDMKFGENDIGVFKNRPDYNEKNTTAQLKVSQRLLVTSGKSAKINFDKEVNVVLNSADPGGQPNSGVVQSARIQRITAGNSMNITPTVGAGGMVSVKIEVEVSANGEIDPDTGVPVDTTRRRISSEVQIANHETISIGGIFDDQKRAATGNEVPFLGKLPILGNLFSNRSKSKSQTELLVLITPHLHTNGEGGTEIQYPHISGL